MPDSIDAAIDRAAIDFREGRVREAETQLRKLLTVAPNHLDVCFGLGILLGRTGRWAEAADHFQTVVTAAPRREEALFWLALSKKNLGDPVEGAALCERALQIDPSNPVILNELGLCRLTLNQAEAASVAFRRAARRDPLKGVYQFNYGLALARLDLIYKAQEAFQEAIRLEPTRVEAYLELARILETLGLRDEAVTMLQRAVRRNPASLPLQSALASAHSHRGEAEEAEAIYRRLMDADPVYGHSMGPWLQQEGRFAESVECFKTSIRALPEQGLSYYGLAEAKVFDIDGQAIIERILPLMDSDALDLKGRMYLAYALAKAYEHQGDHENTIKTYDLANELAHRQFQEGRPFDRVAMAKLTDEAIARYSPAPQPGASDSRTPIFIVGMIRSGTTLLDQIVSGHPEVRSAGEPVYWMREADRVRRLPNAELSAKAAQDLATNYLAAKGAEYTEFDVTMGGPDKAKMLERAPNAMTVPQIFIGETHVGGSDDLAALEAVTGPSPRISDKMPLNYSHLGLIHRIFPHAKIIHLRRNPMDTCLSIYTTFLGQGPNFAYDQSNIVFNYREYLRLMAHWRTVLPASIFMEVDYEALTEDKEAVARQIIAFCDLPWSDECLRHDQNLSAIRTPSKWQARQPVYRTSVNRWRRYEPWLREILELR